MVKMVIPKASIPTKIPKIPDRILSLVTELNSGRNDGWVEQGIREELKGVKAFISKALKNEKALKKGDR